METVDCSGPTVQVPSVNVALFLVLLHTPSAGTENERFIRHVCTTIFEDHFCGVCINTIPASQSNTAIVPHGQFCSVWSGCTCYTHIVHTYAGHHQQQSISVSPPPSPKTCPIHMFNAICNYMLKRGISYFGEIIHSCTQELVACVAILGCRAHTGHSVGYCVFFEPHTGQCA